MTKALFKATLGAALAALGWQAAQAAPEPAAALPSNGPLVAGVCELSQGDLLARSKVGAAADARLRTIAQQVQASLDAEKTTLERRGNALNAERPKLTPAQFQAKAQAINQRAQSLQAEATERSRQLDATRRKALNGILVQAQPYIGRAFTAHSCGLLISREVVLGGNLANDLTAEVIAALDAAATPTTFDLEPPSPAPAN